MSEQHSVTICGTAYQFKQRPTLGLMRQAAKVEAKFDAVSFRDALLDDAKHDEKAALWKEYCNLVCENPDAGLDFDILTVEEVLALRAGFTAAAVGMTKTPSAA